MARVTLTKTKDICNGDGKETDTQDETMSTSELIKLMKKKMMMKKKIGKARHHQQANLDLCVSSMCVCVCDNRYESLNLLVWVGWMSSRD